MLASSIPRVSGSAAVRAGYPIRRLYRAALIRAVAPPSVKCPPATGMDQVSLADWQRSAAFRANPDWWMVPSHLQDVFGGAV